MTLAIVLAISFAVYRWIRASSDDPFGAWMMAGATLLIGVMIAGPYEGWRHGVGATGVYPGELWSWITSGNLSAAAAVLGLTVLGSFALSYAGRERGACYYEHIRLMRGVRMKEKRYACIRRAGLIAAITALSAAAWWATIKGLRFLFKGQS